MTTMNGSDLARYLHGSDAVAAAAAREVAAALDPRAPHAYCVGVDIGELQDYTAIVVAEAVRRAAPDGRMRHVPPSQDTAGYSVPAIETTYLVRRAERLELRVGYALVAARILEILCDPELLHARRAGPIQCRLDASGVGRGPYEVVRDALAARQEAAGQVTLTAVTFVAGDQWRHIGHEASFGKRLMASRLAGMLQPPARVALTGQREDYWRDLLTELRDYTIRIEASTGHDTYGAVKPGSHDDLVTGLGLAVATPEDPFGAAVHYSDFRVY